MDQIPINSEINFRGKKAQMADGASQSSSYLDNSKILDKVQKESGFQFQNVFR